MIVLKTNVFLLRIRLLALRELRSVFCWFFKEEAGYRVSDVVFNEVEVNRLLIFGAVLNRLLNNDARLLEELLALSQVDNPREIMSGDLAEFAGAWVHGRDDDKHAFSCEHRAVADHDLLDVADSKAVDKPEAVWRHLFEPDNLLAFVLDLDHCAVVRDNDLVLRATASFGDVCVHAQHIVVAVHGHKEARVDFLVDPECLVAVGMARACTSIWSRG